LGKNGNMEFNHIPYKGGGPLMTDAVAGHVPLAMGTVFLSKPHIDNKRIRPLAGARPLKRVAEFPDVPTIAEARLCRRWSAGAAGCLGIGQDAT
jgi:tripartite-type tricarboxylate transporter receptor subunit TctC